MKPIKKKKIVILGAGITGLALAYYLSKDNEVLVLEKENFEGGIAFSFKYKDFVLDFGPHKLYSELPNIIAEMGKISSLLKIKKKNSIFLKNNYYDFPLSIKQIALKMPSTAIQAMTDILTKSFYKKPDDSYENYLLNRFGKTLYNLSFRDYAEKVWKSDPKNLDVELAKRRVAISGILELVKSVLLKQTKNISAEYFYYPEKGMLEFFSSLTKKIKANKGKIITNARIEKIEIKNNKVSFINLRKRKIKPDILISTIPLDSLANILFPKNLFLVNAENLNYQSLNIIYFILNKEKALNDCWIFFPEKSLLFQRVSEQKAFSNFCCPKNKTAIMVETTQKLIPENIKIIINQLECIGILKKEEIIEYFFKSLPKCYPLYKKGFLSCLNPLISYLDKLDNLYTIGRQGLFNYNNMDHCWDMAMKLSSHIEQNQSKEEWIKTRKEFDSYKIVD